MKSVLGHTLALAAIAVLAGCASAPQGSETANAPKDPCLGVAPAVGTSIVRKDDCAAGRKQTSVSTPASGGAVYDKKLERSGQAGR